MSNLIIEGLNMFEPISLAEMDAVELLDRTDTKYVVNIAQLSNILHSLHPYYKVLTINNCRCFDYETHYFDTADMSFYHRHHRGLRNRLKIRYRRYVQSDLNYFEIKFKNNKSRTIKKRIKTPYAGPVLGDDAKAFVQKNTKYTGDQLQLSAINNFSRITLISNKMDERATIDLSLHVKRNDTEKYFPLLGIVEVKQSKFDYSSPISRLLKSMHILPASISKYCWTVIMCDNKIRANNFKPQKQYLSKILKTEHNKI